MSTTPATTPESRALTMQSALRPPFVASVLKEDATSRVERILGRSDIQIFRKTYTTRPFLLWRTFLIRSKAQREYENLETLVASDIPCVQPLGWGETRVMGCVPTCFLAVEAFGTGATLKHVFANPMGNSIPVRTLVAQYGSLVRALHVRGFVSLTAFPRNVLFDAEATMLCDQPYLLHFGRSTFGTWMADVDLYDAAFTTGRKHELSKSERLRLVIAYCAGDRSMARAIWARLDPRSRRRHRVARAASLASALLGRPRQWLTNRRDRSARMAGSLG